VKSNVDLESKYLSMLPVKVEIKFAKALLRVNKQAVNLVETDILILNRHYFSLYSVTKFHYSIPELA
jgi:hypothetical protein